MYEDYTKFIGNLCDLVQLVGANVRAKCEAKVQQEPLATKVLIRNSLALGIHQRKWAANQNSTDGSSFFLLLC